MDQLYFATIILGLIGGLGLLEEQGRKRLGITAVINEDMLNSESSRLLIGVGSIVVGVLRLVVVSQGNSPIVGDLIPSASLIIAGLIYLAQNYSGRQSQNSRFIADFNRIFVEKKELFGYLAILSAVLHFIFNRVVLL